MEEILYNLEMGLANDAATLRGPLPTPDGTASVRQDPRQYKEARIVMEIQP